MKFPGRRLRTALAACLVVAATAFSLAEFANAGELAGKVSRIRGAAAADRAGAHVTLAEGAVVYTEDVLTTGEDGRLEITLEDDTKLTLGANANLTIDTFVFEPEASKGTALLTVVKGAFRFTTGKLSGMADKKVEVKTVFANLAVRGTDFWGGPLNNQYGVLVLKGKVEVANEKGKVLIDQPMHGADVAAIGAKPEAPKAWPEAKRDKALASVNF